jgi:arylsulfatase A-like enzyme
MDGRSPAQVLAQSREVVSEWTFGDARKKPLQWHLENADFLEPVDGIGLQVTPLDQGGPAQLRFMGNLDSSTVNSIEIDMRLIEIRYARITWRCADDSQKTVYSLIKMIRDSRAPQTVRIDLAGEGHWKGIISDLVLEPETSGNLPFRFLNIRFVQTGFTPGATPSGADHGDGGLVAIGDVARRSWPADRGVPLVARCRLPEGAFFRTYLAAPPCEENKVLDCALDIRVRDGTWTGVKRFKVHPGKDWLAVRTDLSAFEGQEAELRMTVLESGGEIRPRSEPRRTVCLWGEPVVVGRRSGSNRPNVLLITLDTTRGDHVGDALYTPCLARLGREGLIFENAWSNSNSTTPSHASILTGIYTVEHGAIDNSTVLQDENTLLSERFREAGYHTGAAVSVAHIQALVGFGQGFDRFNVTSAAHALDGSLTVKSIAHWIRDWNEEGGGPFFLWLHLFDPHSPYFPPDDYVKSYAERLGREIPPASTVPATVPQLDEGHSGHYHWMRGISNRDHLDFLYQSGVAYADHLVEGVLEILGSAGFIENTWIVVTADHGESLGEHDVWYSHHGLYDVNLKVPLIMKVPGGPSHLKVRDTVCTLDIVPTLTSRLGLDPVPDARGVDLLDIARNGGDPRRPLWFEHSGLYQFSVRDANYHFMLTTEDHFPMGLLREEGEPAHFGNYQYYPKGTCRLFPVGSESSASRDMATAEPELVETYTRALKTWQKSLSERKSMKRELSPSEVERLRQLGYGGY